MNGITGSSIPIRMFPIRKSTICTHQNQKFKHPNDFSSFKGSLSNHRYTGVKYSHKKIKAGQPMNNKPDPLARFRHIQKNATPDDPLGLDVSGKYIAFGIGDRSQERLQIRRVL